MAENKDNTMAIVGLILNIIILPGLGTLVGGGKSRVTTGILQLVLFLVGIPLSIILIGIPLMIGMWIWALVTGIQMVKEA
jgi:TM2 domain-containing membrane protein YozV